jgi:hypothetical protein
MITKVSDQELTVKAETQYLMIVRLHQMFESTQDFGIEDLYLTQLAMYAKLMQQVKVIAPRLLSLKLDGILRDIVKLETELNKPDQVLTQEIVAQAELLFDTAAALGWEMPQPAPLIFTCEICGARGQLGVEIVERPYYDTTLRRDNTRYECKNIQACLTRTGR